MDQAFRAEGGSRLHEETVEIAVIATEREMSVQA